MHVRISNSMCKKTLEIYSGFEYRGYALTWIFIFQGVQSWITIQSSWKVSGRVATHALALAIASSNVEAWMLVLWGPYWALQ